MAWRSYEIELDDGYYSVGAEITVPQDDPPQIRIDEVFFAELPEGIYDVPPEARRVESPSLALIDHLTCEIRERLDDDVLSRIKED